jgi:hypothetical protein
VIETTTPVAVGISDMRADSSADTTSAWSTSSSR